MSSFHLLDSVGNTPLVELQRMSPDPRVRILVKLEYLNPSGSIKDRIVKYILDHAEATGSLEKGGTIVENTSGNTGAAVAMIGALKGYRVILTMPDKVSLEKQNALRAYGAEVVVCPTSARPNEPDHYVNAAKRLAKQIRGSFRLDQYDNPKNSEAHFLTTGPEIWKQTEGSIDYFVASGSTGGTVSGVGRYLKSQKNVRIVMPDPFGSIYYDHFYGNPIDLEAGCSYHVEGVGEDHLAKAMDFSVVDEMLQFDDGQAFSVARQLAEQEGILAGGSGGANVWAAIEIAKQASCPLTIVTIIPDGGVKYLSKIYNDSWWKAHDMQVASSVYSGRT